jgi:DHA1 family multidrug resistance protein-like MFS transporter
MSATLARQPLPVRVSAVDPILSRITRLHGVTAISGVAFGLTAPLTVVYASALGAGGFLAGVAVSAVSLVILLIDFFGTRWTPRLEPRLALTISLVFFGVGSLSSAAAPNLAVMIISRCLQGVGVALFQGAGPQLAVRLRPPGREGKALGQFQAAWFAGIAMGPLIGGTIAIVGSPLFGLRLAFAVCGAVSFAAAVFVYALLPALPSAIPPELGLPRLSAMASRRAGLVLTIGGFGQAIRSGIALTLLPLAATQQYGLTGLGLGLSLSLLAFVDVSSMHLGGHLADRYGRMPVLLFALLIGVPVLLLMSAGHIGWMFFLLCLLLGVPVGVTWIVPSAMAVDLAGNVEVGLASYRIAGDIGMGAGGVLTGALISGMGISSALAIVSIGLVVPAALAVAVRETRVRIPGESLQSQPI